MESEHLVGTENVLSGMGTPVPVVEGVDNHREGEDDVMVATHGQQQAGGMAYLAPGQQVRLPVAASERSPTSGPSTSPREHQQKSPPGVLPTGKHSSRPDRPAGTLSLSWK